MSPVRDINDCLSVLRFDTHFDTRTDRVIKDFVYLTLPLRWISTHKGFVYLTLPLRWISTQKWLNFLPFKTTSRKWKSYVVQMSQLLSIQDNQPTIPVCMPNSNGTGVDTVQQNINDAGSELLNDTSLLQYSRDILPLCHNSSPLTVSLTLY
jgi:hypothetical protein